MGDYDHIGRAVEPLYRMAVVGFFAIVVLIIAAIVGGGWFLWWLVHHVKVV